MIDLSINSFNAVDVKTGVNAVPSGATVAATQDALNRQMTNNVNSDSSAGNEQHPQDNGADSQEQLQTVTEQLSQTMELMRKGLQFRVDDKSGESVVSVLDMESGDIIRQIPSEEALKLAAKLSEVADGLLMKTQV
ncbi:flagellar protein FlaG [Shewanella yunxiaonensis]|uniref:Flagellar protein FlaG n=1 Tax=Shewanella yunxiaonensis TaxID=2829809 RepID=A0ABX7YVY6_9GAMM|nr:flagellar protein FlaG [Shewanella yunxiaonensis]QUN06847.1 flagellar protein FlaG [Shewanella yunxiaonensis]